MLNSFVGIGRLGQDAELSSTRDGRPMARFSIAINRIPRAGQEKQTEPDWIRCVLFGERAVLLSPYLNKGVLIGVRGRLNSYRTNEENPRQMMSLDVSELNFLHRPQSSEQQNFHSEERAQQKEEPRAKKTRKRKQSSPQLALAA